MSRRNDDFMEQPEKYEFFAFVVQDEVASIFPAHKEYFIPHIQAWSSNPKIVTLSDNEKNVVKAGWLYDEQSGSFSQPSE